MRPSEGKSDVLQHLFRVPQIGADQRLAAVEIDLLGGDQDAAARRLAVDRAGFEQRRIDRDLCPAVDAQCLAQPRARKRSARPRDWPAGSRSCRPGCCRAGPGSAGSASSITWTKPGVSPFGEASSRPEASAEAITRNGDSAIKARECFSSRGICFLTARSLGSPYNSRISRNVLDDVHPRLLSLFEPSMPQRASTSRRRSARNGCAGCPRGAPEGG